MQRLREVADLDECEELWRATMPTESLTDLWEVRYCFHRHFRRPARFLAIDDGSSTTGLLPLSWIEETDTFGFFPGETWLGRTWLEQNRIQARDAEGLSTLLRACPPNVELRYLAPFEGMPDGGVEVDELGYHFVPESYGFNLENYLDSFSHKHAKRLLREIDEIERRGLRYRFDDLADLDDLVALNLNRFKGTSYFESRSFRQGFCDLARLLADRGWLRMTTILHGKRPVAVDLGCLYRGVYTLLAGGTHADYPGIAKVINLRHMHRACTERLERVDFLCGDFSWKTLFHLEPRPLYLFRGDRVPLTAGPGTIADVHNAH